MTKPEDVYETADLPESEQSGNKKEEKFESEHIESIQLDVGAAYQRFKGRLLSSENMGSEEKAETIESRYNRLQQELIELEQDLQSVKKSGTAEKSAENAAERVSAKEVTGLQQQLKQLQVEQILGQTASGFVTDPALVQKLSHSIEQVKHSKPAKKQPTKAEKAGSDAVYELFVTNSENPVSKLSEVESRLTKLEGLVGSDVDKLVALSGSEGRGRGMVDAVEILNQKLQMLDLNHIDSVEARLGVFIQKLTLANEKKLSLDSGDIGRVNELYELMKKWDGFCASLPDLVARMQALQDLHEQALQFSQSLTQLDAVQQQLLKNLETDEKLLNEAKTSFSANMEVMKSNCESLDQRLKALPN